MDDFWQNFYNAYQTGGIQAPKNLTTTTEGPGFWSWDRFLGQPNQMGWGQVGLGTLGSLSNLYLGMQQYGVARDRLREDRRQFDMNYANQRDLINTRLEDRQRARVASNPNAYESVDSYMNRNRIR